MLSSSPISQEHTLSNAFPDVLRNIATKGSWYGGGSAAALTCATAAALVEKLSRRPAIVAAASAIRQRSARLIDEDAQVFSRVIYAISRQPGQFRKRLKTAIEVPRQVRADAYRVLRLARDVKRMIPPRYHVDLQCAEALAVAAAASADALIATNLAWLNEPGYAARLRRRLMAQSS